MTAQDMENRRKMLAICPCTAKDRNPEWKGEWCPLLQVVYLRRKT